MKFLGLLLVPFALLAVGLIRLLARFGILIRFGEFWSDRIGHLAANTECYLCEKDAGLHPGIHIWTHRNTISNLYLAKMFSRVMFVDWTRFSRLVMLCNSLFQGWEKHTVSSTQVDRDIHDLFSKQLPHLSFTEAEEARGQALLRSMGIPEGAKWVCLIVRDGAYLPGLPYHSYRDTNIYDYGPAALELAKRGYYVLRMGAKVVKAWPKFHSKVIDYATNGMRSEFADVYLGAKCEFCISTGTGFDAIPVIFRRPICYVNYVPVEYLSTHIKDSIAIWKHHIKDGKRMSFQEIIESGAGQFMRAEEFEAAGIKLQDNTPEEIKDAVLEIAESYRHRPRYAEDIERQNAFWAQFPRAISPYNSRPLHGNIRMRIGAKFLEGYVSTEIDCAA